MSVPSLHTARLVWITPEAEQHIAYCARVSNPKNQDNPDYAKLLRYCIKHKHWSIFEMASMAVEITTLLPIATQILRHKSFSFQQFSARYAEVEQFGHAETRLQDSHNRQHSQATDDTDLHTWFQQAQHAVVQFNQSYYHEALARGIAKEQARFLLPQLAVTRMYMAGTLRSWLHYVDVRAQEDTQIQHRYVAQSVRTILYDQVPTIARAMWGEQKDL